MSVRKAKHEDIKAMVELCEQKRREYVIYQPLFHKPASDAALFQETFFRSLIDGGNAIVLVYVKEGRVRGAVYGSLRVAPPVYEPGGKVCVIDDFVMRSEDDWMIAGQALLNTMSQIAKEKGAVLTNIVCGPKDNKKKKFLSELGYSIASEWHIKAIE